MTPPTLRPLSFGEILDGAFTLYRRNFLRFVGTSLLLLVGLVVAIVILAVAGAGAVAVMPGPMKIVTIVLVSICVLALATLPWGALTWQAGRSVQDKPRPLGDSLEAAGGSAMTLVGCGLIATVAVAGVLYGAGRVAPLVQRFVDGTGSPTLASAWGVAAPLGILMLFLCVSTLFFGVLPAVLLEEKGPVDAIIRSVQLARGAQLRIMGVLLVAWVIVSLPSLASLAFLGGVQGLANPGGDIGAILLALVVQQLFSIVVSILTMPFMPSVLVLLYYDRRVRTEGLDVQLTAAQAGLAAA